MDDKMSLTTNINNALKSDFIIQMMKRNWESSRSIGVLGNLFGEVYTHMIIHKDGYGFEYYMSQMETLYSKLGTKQIDMEQTTKCDKIKVDMHFCVWILLIDKAAIRSCDYVH